MAFKKGDRVKFKTGGDQWAYMKDMKILAGGGSDG